MTEEIAADIDVDRSAVLQAPLTMKGSLEHPISLPPPQGFATLLSHCRDAIDIAEPL